MPSTRSHELPGFGARLRQLRRTAGIKQAHVAQLAGVNQTTVSRWESGAICPTPAHAKAILGALQPSNREDSILRRLVESSSLILHLITDIDHLLLAASPAREAEWGVSVSSIVGRSIWSSASPVIVDAEANLESQGWWECSQPAPIEIELEAFDSGFLPIVPGCLRWERVWLADGQPARLCTLLKE